MILGSRGSDLALWQTRFVQARLLEQGQASEIKIITTAGDVSLAERLVGSLEKGFFTAELEAELHQGTIDAAVHSLKDLPTRLPSGLNVGAILPRANAFDLLIVREDYLDSSLVLPVKTGSRVGASSLRRDALLKHHAPHCTPVPLRGNVPTRVQKLRSGDVDAIVLAAAGVQRLQLDLHGLHVFAFNPRVFVPAPGQGAVAIETRANDHRTVWAALNHEPTEAAVAIERGLLHALLGGCTTPFGAYYADNVLTLGQALKTGWHTLSMPCDGTASLATDDRFISQALEALAATSPAPVLHNQGSNHDNWLVRPL